LDNTTDDTALAILNYRLYEFIALSQIVSEDSDIYKEIFSCILEKDFCLEDYYEMIMIFNKGIALLRDE